MKKLEKTKVTNETTNTVVFEEIEGTPLTAISKDNGQKWQVGFAGGLITPKEFESLDELKKEITKIDWWTIYSFVVAIIKTKKHLFENENEKMG